jgi:hypothetical protein
MLLTKEAILSCEDRGFEIVEVPEWGGSVRVASMTAAERDKFEQMIVDKKSGAVKLDNLRATLAAHVLVDDDGERLFTDKDLIALSKKSATAVSRVFDAAQRLNAFSDDDVEELAKN